MAIVDPATVVKSTAFLLLSTPSDRNKPAQREFLCAVTLPTAEERWQELAASAVDCPHDLLAVMIQVEDLSEEELTDTLLSLHFAGHETTAGTLTPDAIYLISQQHASVVEQHCLEEIEQQANADSEEP
jgi:cytochrome P450